MLGQSTGAGEGAGQHGALFSSPSQFRVVLSLPPHLFCGFGAYSPTLCRDGLGARAGLPRSAQETAS